MGKGKESFSGGKGCLVTQGFSDSEDQRFSDSVIQCPALGKPASLQAKPVGLQGSASSIRTGEGAASLPKVSALKTRP